MSQRYKGAVISATPPTTTGGNSGTAPGIWTMQQQLQAQGGGVWPNQPIWYVEDVFSTYLYTGTGASQTITNNIDTTTYGGLVWVKGRSGATGHRFTDTARGTTKSLASNNTAAQGTEPNGLTAFGTSGFTIGADVDYNNNAATYASWTFRKQAKFFDVVTYTGNGTSQEIAHSLGSTPGCLIIKRTDAAADWPVWQRNIINNFGFYRYMKLNTTDAVINDSTVFGVGPDETVFRVGSNSMTNASGGTYVAYLFAHNAGGFGATASDNVISCGSFTSDGSGNASVTLGYEPQWVLVKNAQTSGDTWQLLDVMRGFAQLQQAFLYPPSSGAESVYTGTNYAFPTATGFQYAGGILTPSNTHIYIAIRRGPMKTPTSGTSVYDAVARTGTGANATVASSFPVDLYVVQPRSNLASTPATWINRLAGGTAYLRSNASFGEATLGTSAFGTVMNGVSLGGDTETNYSSSTFINWFMRRAPGFMDVVCYDGTNNDIALTHNLGVAPEAIILKKRSSSGDWAYETNFTSTQHTSFTFNSTGAGQAWNYSSGIVLTAQPTSTTVTVAGGGYSTSGSTYVMYLFASCPGVSKVGSYSGTGATQTISCGFAARFVMIKRTDSTGSWWVWDTTRGMVAGTDPKLAWQTNADETNANWVYTDASGFQIVTTDATVNASGGSYIYLAIA